MVKNYSIDTGIDNETVNKLAKRLKKYLFDEIKYKSRNGIHGLYINKVNTTDHLKGTTEIRCFKMEGLRQDIFCYKDNNQEYCFKIDDLAIIIMKMFEEETEIDVKYRPRKKIIEIYWCEVKFASWISNPQKTYRLYKKNKLIKG